MYVHDTFIRDNLIKILKQFLPNFEKAFSIDSFTLQEGLQYAIIIQLIYRVLNYR